MIRIPRSNSLWLFCLLFCTNLHAQFKNKAALQPVVKTGFYSINITPELSAYIKADFSDVRVLDDKDKQVPYIIRSVTPPVNINSGEYQPLTIVKNELADSGNTLLLVENPGKQNTGNLILVIRNAAVSRTANLSGSDDGKKWYSILENIGLQKTTAADSSSYLAEILFPFNNYRFFKLAIHNGKNDPLNIIAVKTAKTNSAPVVDIGDIKRYEINPACTFAQTDSSDGYSYIKVHNVKPYHVSRIVLKVAAPKFFKRDADVIVPYGQTANFSMVSDTIFNFYLPVFNSGDWMIRIFNGDNPPLVVKNIATQQDALVIVPYMEEGKAYHLVMNDANAPAPQYDLQNFRDSIPAHLQAVQLAAIEAAPAQVKAADTSIFKKAWIWAVIVAILTGLIFFTTQLSKEVAKKKDDGKQ